MRTDAQGRRLCAATAKSTGEPCRAPAVTAATVCRVHGAGKGSPAREKANNTILLELIGPALLRLKGLIYSGATPPAVVLAAIRETLDRTGYREYHEMSSQQLEPHIERLLEELQGEQTLEEKHAHHVRMVEFHTRQIEAAGA